MNYNLCLQHVLSEALEKQAPQPGCVRVVLQLLRRGEKVFTALRRSSWQAGRRRSDRRSRVGRDCSAADGSMLISISGCCCKELLRLFSLSRPRIRSPPGYSLSVFCFLFPFVKSSLFIKGSLWVFKVDSLFKYNCRKKCLKISALVESNNNNNDRSDGLLI